MASSRSAAPSRGRDAAASTPEELVGDDGALGDSGVVLFELREREGARANTELEAAILGFNDGDALTGESPRLLGLLEQVEAALVVDGSTKH